jgi:hypothetical protein
MAVPAATMTPTAWNVRPPAGMGFANGTLQAVPLRKDNWLVHFLRYMVIGLVMGLSMLLIVGIFWLATAMSSTGRRKRDILMLFIPLWGTIVQVQTLWRYTAKNVYWSVRADRPSKSLFAN